MSGGSHNYLALALRSDPDEAWQRLPYIEEMRDRLHEAGFEPEAAEFAELVKVIKDASLLVRTSVERLRPVMHAVEWWDSGDWGRDRVERVIEEHRIAKNKSP